MSHVDRVRCLQLSLPKVGKSLGQPNGGEEIVGTPCLNQIQMTLHLSCPCLFLYWSPICCYPSYRPSSVASDNRGCWVELDDRIKGRLTLDPEVGEPWETPASCSMVGLTERAWLAGVFGRSTAEMVNIYTRAPVSHIYRKPD